MFCSKITRHNFWYEKCKSMFISLNAKAVPSVCPAACLPMVANVAASAAAFTVYNCSASFCCARFAHLAKELC